MNFDSSEPRVPSGGAAGGQWGGSSKKSTKSAKSSKQTPHGTKPGAPRSADAAKAQSDPKAQKLYADLMKLPPEKRAAYAKGLNDADLEKLTEIAYSSRSSDPDVVKARVAVANEMTKRGVDIKKYGAQGGGLAKATPASSPHKSVSAPKSAPHAKAAPKPAARPAPAVRPTASGGGAFRSRAE